MNPSGALLIRIVAGAGRRPAAAKRAPLALTIDKLSLIGTSEARLARGRRMFEVLPSRIELEIVRVIDTPEATHIRYRVRK